jgi:putative heme-binding domain-containing protein
MVYYFPLRSSRAFRFLLVVTALALPLAALWSGPAMPTVPQPQAPVAGTFTLKNGDRVCIIGNTLAERMQHDGWLETYLHSRFPKHNLVFRNLGFSGDELTLRLRSASFGKPDEWLTRCKADVVFAFFGYNESFAGAEGLPKFKQDLDQFLKHTLSQKYNGKSPPRVVLFSPITHEDMKDHNLPDGMANNARLKLYAQAMAEVASANKVSFVDLFTLTSGVNIIASSSRVTINGIHLNEVGNQYVASVIDFELFGERLKQNRADRANDPREIIRRAVIDKNHYWFNRYRTVDGYSIYGGRADLKFVAGQTNREVMQREMEVLDTMTANRDKRIWAIAARGGKEDPACDDSNTPPFISVVSNKPGPLPGGKHLFLDGEEAIKKMTVAPGFKVNLFASEKEFPELANPVQMAWDTQGRLWVAVWPTYPHWKPKEPMNDKLIILEDTNGDGKADKRTIFADDLHNPTGFEFYNGGVIVAQMPDLLYLKDTKGDGKADVKQRILHGLDSADTHHAANSFVLDPGGAIYFQEGTFHHTQVETPYGPPQRCANAGVFRYEPRTQKFDVYITFGFANPHGHVFDKWGQDIVIDGTGSQPYHAALFSGFLPFPRKHATPPQVYQQWTRPCPGMEILSSRHFPEKMQGNLLVANVIGYQGILQYKLSDNGASFSGTEGERILSSSDPNFRPSDLKVGPDGAIYFLDWHNPIIGHMQHNLRDPSRDREHGRIYRITYEGRPLLTPEKIAGEPVEKLLDLLTSPEDRVRYRVRIELASRKTADVIAATKKWLNDPRHMQLLPVQDRGNILLEALWLHQSHNVVDLELLQQVLKSPDFRVRAAATRVLCYWRDRVPNALELVKRQAADSHPRVRLEAIRASSFFTVPEAVEVALIAREHPSDQYLDFVRGETMKALGPHLRKAIAARQPIRFSTATGKRYFVTLVGTEDLMKMERTSDVCMELLKRPGVREEHRKEAVTALARLEHKTEPRLLLEALHRQEEAQTEDSVAFDLARLLTARAPTELTGLRPALAQLATGAKRPVLRHLGFVALVSADQGIDKAWALATRTTAGLHDLVAAMPLLANPGHRADLYPKIEPLLAGLPKELAAQQPVARSLNGRFVRIDLPGKQQTLTLAEVEVFSNGRNIAPQGKASQKNTAYSGDARRAVDGNTSGRYNDGGQTHSWEGTENPWWELDLGAEQSLESIVVYNRMDENLGKRLQGFTLQVLDAHRNVVFVQTDIPAPVRKATFPVSEESPERRVRHAAMLALTCVRGQEGNTFKALARFVPQETDRAAAIQAILRIPVTHWPTDDARPLLAQLIALIRMLPVAERTSPGALDALQLADSLATLLPPAEAKQMRRELGQLSVRVLRLGTVPDRMIFDQERLFVQAGRPVEILLENTDLMPHNFVIVQPGALEEVGLQAEAEATDPGALARHYVPKSGRILLSSRLLQPREMQRLRFNAPTQPGVYPYVCTYPGHWRRMFGALYVVSDLDECLADAEGYLAKNPLLVSDALLKFNRPRKEWKYEDLVVAVDNLDHGRSYANGKQMFQVANCVACHKLHGVGYEIGADLTKLDPKTKPTEILRDVLEPSHRINEKYQTWVLETESGKLITGLILEETPTQVKVIENPLAKNEPVLLKPSEIVNRKKSDQSIMPKGLLDKLSREEILDLLAYLIARGDAGHKLFKDSGHSHGHGPGRGGRDGHH